MLQRPQRQKTQITPLKELAQHELEDITFSLSHLQLLFSVPEVTIVCSGSLISNGVTLQLGGSLDVL